MLGFDFDGLPDVNQDDNDYFFVNMVDNTKYYRSFIDDLPSNFVSLTDDGGSVTFWVDTSTINNDEMPIYAYIYGNYKKISDSFLDFLGLILNQEDLYKSL